MLELPLSNPNDFLQSLAFPLKDFLRQIEKGDLVGQRSSGRSQERVEGGRAL